MEATYRGLCRGLSAIGQMWLDSQLSSVSCMSSSLRTRQGHVLIHSCHVLRFAQEWLWDYAIHMPCRKWIYVCPSCLYVDINMSTNINKNVVDYKKGFNLI